MYSFVVFTCFPQESGKIEWSNLYVCPETKTWEGLKIESRVIPKENETRFQINYTISETVKVEKVIPTCNDTKYYLTIHSDNKYILTAYSNVLLQNLLIHRF